MVVTLTAYFGAEYRALPAALELPFVNGVVSGQREHNRARWGLVDMVFAPALEILFGILEIPDMHGNALIAAFALVVVTIAHIFILSWYAAPAAPQ